MALAPGRQFHPATSFFDSFQSSFSKFHGTSIQFFRYSSSIPYKKHTFYANSVQNPHRKSHILSTNRPVSSNSSSWIDKWNETHKQNGPKQPRDVLNYRSSSGSGSGSVSGNVLNSSSVKSDGSSGGSSSTMEKIVEKLKTFGYIDDGNEGKEKGHERVIEKGSVEDIFYVEEGMLPNSRGGFSPESPLGVESMFGGDGEVRFPWEKPKEKEKEEEGGIMARRKSRTSLAELTLPESELRRLRILTFQKKHKTRIGGAGVTQEVVDMIRERWKTSEIVRLKFEGAAALNMKRMHEILERKTGGLVIWRSGTSLSLYRGVSFEVPEVKLNKRILKKKEFPSNSLPTATEKTTRGPSESGTDGNVHAPKANSNSTAVEKKVREPLPEVKYEDEVDKLLDGLGPRYTDWPGCDPLPVDADMLPAVVSGYQPPFRVLPYGVRSTLGAKDATNLRRLARVLPPHFALGRNRQLQGLAMAMIKLWERSSIAKIALKRGVQLTTSERMAEEIKKLTGGILLSRNKDFLVFYRGKNFLSPDVTEALLERETLAKSLQDEEEQARLRASALIIPRVEITEQSGIAGTLGETLDADARWGKTLLKALLIHRCPSTPLYILSFLYILPKLFSHPHTLKLSLKHKTFLTLFRISKEKLMEMGFAKFQVFMMILGLLATLCIAQAPGAAPKASPPTATPPTATPPTATPPTATPPAPTPSPKASPTPSPAPTSTPPAPTPSATPAPSPSPKAPSSAPTPSTSSPPAPASPGSSPSESPSSEAPPPPSAAFSTSKAVIAGTALVGTFFAAVVLA